jgi:hypothetical protein
LSYCLSNGPISDWSGGANAPGLFTANVHFAVRDVVDGTSNTIAMSEVKIGAQNSAKTDYSIVMSAGNLVNGTSTIFTNSAASIAAIDTYYSSCLTLYNGSPTLQNITGQHWSRGASQAGPFFNTLVTPNKGPGCDRDTSTTIVDLKPASSYHTGGVQAVMADGAVRFVSDNIDQGVFIAAGSRNGSEVQQINLD